VKKENNNAQNLKKKKKIREISKKLKTTTKENSK